MLKSSEAIIAEIHNEFDTAQDRLLSEAKAIIANADKKGERLAKVGFVNTPSAKLVPQIVKSKEQADLINYYQQHYPFQKFLTEEELERICKKYDLIFAPVANYIKDVPEKNLRDIENAKPLVRSHSMTDVYELNISRGLDDFNRFLNLIGHPSPLFTKEEEIAISREYYGNHSPESWSFGGSSDNMLFYGAKEKLKCDFRIESYSKTSRDGLFIAAPKSHFNLKGLNKSGTFGFLNITVREVKDPIVFRYCKGGIQVLTKWGKEAEDSALVNPIEN